MARKIRAYGISVAIAAAFLTAAVPAYAQEISSDEASAKRETRVIQSEYADASLRLYISGLEADGDDLLYQIGNEQVDIKSVKKLEESGIPVRTLLMLDNSLSISEANRGRAKELMKAIADSHTDGEEIRVALFDEQVNYLTDYTSDYEAAKNAIEGIEYINQETYLTDALYGVLDERDDGKTEGYQRIVIISDGVDNKPIGVTKDELYDRIKKEPVQIYTIGSLGKDNNEELKNMFALSRLTYGQDYILDETDDASEVTNRLRQDLSDISVVEAELPIELQNGASAESQLTLPDGRKLQCSVRLPFGLKEDEPVTEEAEPEPVPDPEPEPQPETVSEEQPETPEPEPEPENGPPLFIIPIVLVAAVAAYVLILLRNKKKNNTQTEIYTSSAAAPMVSGIQTGADDERTVIDEPQPKQVYDDRTVIDGDDRTVITGGYGQGMPVATLVLTDQNMNGREFTCPLSGEVVIGRRHNENGLVIDYDHSISGRHCMVHGMGGRYFVQDLHSTNLTKLNGEVIYGDTELHNGDTLTLGRVVFRVDIR